MNPTPAWLEELVKLPDINTNLRTFGGHRQQVPYGWFAEREIHFAFEMMLIITGVQQTIFDGRVVEFSAGDILLIPPGTAHKNVCISENGLDYFCLHFDLDDPEMQQQLLMYCPILLQPENPEYTQISKIIAKYVEFLAIGVFSCKERLAIEILLLEMMRALLNYADYEKTKIAYSDNTSLLLAKSIAESIQLNFKKYMQDPVEENKKLLSMKKTAESLNISDSTMLKVFKKVYSCSPKQYLDQLRFNESRRLLHQPKLAIGEIAMAVGYQNATHFTRQFKRWANMAPKAYRKSGQLNK